MKHANVSVTIDNAPDVDLGVFLTPKTPKAIWIVVEPPFTNAGVLLAISSVPRGPNEYVGKEARELLGSTVMGVTHLNGSLLGL